MRGETLSFLDVEPPDRHVRMSLDCRADGGAIFSEDRRYRYRLWRNWGEAPELVVIGVNGSTADEKQNDPTVRRSIGYARRWGCGGLIMLNVFGLVSTDPRGLYEAEDPVGPDNDAHLVACCRDPARIVLAAWGNHGAHLGRSRAVRDLLSFRGLECLGRTKAGEPKHPLYLRADLEREVLPWPA